MPKGKVYLVGAGPGDPGLITVKGVECIRRANAVVYDHLANPSLLEEAPKGAQLIYVGKSSSNHTLVQQEINRLLVSLGSEGKTVVRLKGGDPLVFGRGGEEIEALLEAGIPFEIVPGISSAIAVPAYAGIPITHRKLASSFAVVTGHEAPGKTESSIDWNKLATGVDTLIFLMGVANLGHIVGRLMAAGRPGSTLIAVVREGTLPEQQAVTGTLDDIVGKVAAAGLTPPAVIIVGEVVSLAEKMSWFGKHPLRGRRVLVTRTREQASKLSTMLEEQGAEPVELPTIEIETIRDPRLDAVLRAAPQHDWIFFTSANAVDIFVGRLAELNAPAGVLQMVKCAAIGPGTAEALQKHSIVPDYMPRRFVAEGILEDLDPSQVQGKKVLLPRADIARPELAEGLERMGARVENVALYRTVPARADSQAGLSMLRKGAIDIVTFTSSSTVKNLAAMLGNDVNKIDQAMVACIGPVTAATARELGIRVDVIAQVHSIPGLVDALVEAVTEKAGNR